MTIQKFLDIEQAMTAQAWQDTKHMAEQIDALKGQCLETMRAIETIYAPLTSTWNEWCTANLQAAEMNLIKNLYGKCKVIAEALA